MPAVKINNVIVKPANASKLSKVWERVSQAFREFLKVPTLIILGFLVLFILSSIIDHERFAALKPIRDFFKDNIFNDPKATSDLLGTIATSIITVSSLSITLLLIVVQQTASTMSTEVFDQFFRSRHNQIYFGFFIGLALYSITVLATVRDKFNPVFGASLAIVFIVTALYLLIVLIYTTINDMRPVAIINRVYDLTLNARKKQMHFIPKTRRATAFEGPCKTSIQTEDHGYISHINFDRIYEAIKKAKGEVEVVLTISMGEYVTFKQEIAFVTSEHSADGEIVGNAVAKYISIHEKVDIGWDPFGGIVEIETIGWTSISTAKSNPAPGLIAIRALSTLLSRWSYTNMEPGENSYPIVYKDNVVARLMDTFTTLTVAASESMQHQSFIEILQAVTLVFSHLSSQNKIRAEDFILRILSAMGEFVLTLPLEISLNKLVQTLLESGSEDIAKAVETAKNKLSRTIGKLNSRSTRTG